MKTRNKKFSEGFSLAEVTLAIGITAIALVSLMGMLPKGLQNMRRANDKAIEGRINQQILGEINLTPWETGGGSSGSSPVEKFDGEVRYFDDQGIRLNNSEDPSHVYTARITIPRINGKLPHSVGGGTFGGVAAPGEMPSDEANRYSKLVIVEVTSIVDSAFIGGGGNSFDEPKYRERIRSYQTIISKTGRLNQ